MFSNTYVRLYHYDVYNDILGLTWYKILAKGLVYS